ncbi:MAG: endo-1,4-beta-xylanase [Oscillospiraceae bacterium]|nr:endo-1,4-beta-xylanase [Oscillospiraceae bacterium]
MIKKLISVLICSVMMLSLVPAASVYVDRAPDETLLYNFTFEDEAADGQYFTINADTVGSAAKEWVSGPGVGHGDDHALRVWNIDGNYTGRDNAVRLTLPKPLRAGIEYRILAWIYAPSDENPRKSTLTGPGVVLNGDYPGPQGEVKFPENFGTFPMDTWFEMNFVMPERRFDIDFIDFRLVINDADKHPDVWYWDNIEIWQVGDTDPNIIIPEWDLTLPSLAEAFKGHFLIGNIMEVTPMWMSEHAEMFPLYYNTVTVENSMKPLYISPEKGTFNFAGADVAVEWAKEHGLALHGHTLVWHSQSPGWLTYDENRDVLTRAEAKANLEQFVTAYAERYAGRIASWDVVNEAFRNSVTANSNWKRSLRGGTGADMSAAWYEAYSNGMDEAAGEAPYDYIYDAFAFARLAAPDAVLFYNDFNEEEPGKRDAIADMADYFNEKWKDDSRNTEPGRKLIEGIGMQAHYWVSNLDPADVEASIKRFIESGLRIRITELDIPMGSWVNQREVGLPVTDDELNQQAALYRDLFQIFIDHSEHIDAVTVWGLADPFSWRARGLPLLFDEFFSAKPSFWAVLEVANNAPAPAPAPAPDDTAAPPPPVDTDTNTNTTVPALDPVEEGPSSLRIFAIILAAVAGASVIGVIIVAIVLHMQKKKKSD